MSLIIPENYKSNLNGRETEKAIKFIIFNNLIA